MVSGYLLPHPTRQTPSRSSQPSLQASRLIIPILYYGTAPSQVGLGRGNIVLDWDPAPPTGRGTAAPTFSADVYCGQMTGWINTAIGRGVGLGPHDIVLDGDPPPTTGRGTTVGEVSAYCGVLWPNGCMDYDATLEADWVQPAQHFVRWGPSSPTGRGTAAPTFSAHVYFGQMTGWINTAIGTGVGLGPHDIVLDGDPPPHGKGHGRGGSFGILWCIVAKRLHGLRRHFGS